MQYSLLGDSKPSVKDVPAIISAPGLLPLPMLIIFKGTGRTALENGLSPLAAETCRAALQSCLATFHGTAGLQVSNSSDQSHQLCVLLSISWTS